MLRLIWQLLAGSMCIRVYYAVKQAFCQSDTLLAAMQTVLELEPLETGPSIELTGRLHQRRNSFKAHARLRKNGASPQASATTAQQLAQEFTYKLLEGGIRFSQM